MTRKTILLAAVLIVSSAITAHADQILGQWCAPGGTRSVKVDQATVVSPGGKTVPANITRHHVDFVMPDGEKDAGATFNADQLGDEQIRVTFIRKEGTSEPEIWTPCKPVS